MARRRKRKRRTANEPKSQSPPAAQPNPATPPTVTGPPSQLSKDFSAVIAHLEDQKNAIDKLAANKGKDGWDKLSVVATLVSSVLIATVGLVFTFMYQSAESENRRLVREQEDRHEMERAKVRELELVAKLLPELSSNDENKRKQAFLTVNALGNTELMVQLALDDPTAGARAALQAVAVSPQSTNEDRVVATNALDKIRQWDKDILTESSKAVVSVRVEEAGGAMRASTGFVWKSPGLVVTSLHAVIGAERIHVFGNSERPTVHEATIHRTLRSADLVLLKLETPIETQPLEMGQKDPSIGERVILIGYPSGVRSPISTWLSLRPISATTLRRLLPFDVQTSIRQMGVPSVELPVIPLEGTLVPGQAGAPILNIDGKVIGIAAGGLRDSGLSWAIPAQQLTLLFESKENPPTELSIPDSLF